MFSLKSRHGGIALSCVGVPQHHATRLFFIKTLSPLPLSTSATFSTTCLNRFNAKNIRDRLKNISDEVNKRAPDGPSKERSKKRSREMHEIIRQIEKSKRQIIKRGLSPKDIEKADAFAIKLRLLLVWLLCLGVGMWCTVVFG
jgi:hypothetical protein